MNCANCNEVIDATCQSFCHVCGFSASASKRIDLLQGTIVTLTEENTSLKTMLSTAIQTKSELLKHFQELAKNVVDNYADQIKSAMTTAVDDIECSLSSMKDAMDEIEDDYLY